jgi:opacity protein-like surface antigen
MRLRSDLRRRSSTFLARSLPVALLWLLTAGAPRPLSAQSQALVLSVYGGRYSPLVNLTDAGDDLTAAFAFGGGLAFQLSQNAALRVSVTRHRARYRGDAVVVADSSVSRYAYGLDLQLGWPGTSVLVPYVYLGAGAVTTDFDDPAYTSTTGLAGRFGVGLNRVGGMGAWFVEVGTVLYGFDGLGLKRMQFDLEARLGFALAIGL